MLGLCDRFKCLPSQLEAESAHLLKLLMIERLGTPEPRKEEDHGE